MRKIKLLPLLFFVVAACSKSSSNSSAASGYELTTGSSQPISPLVEEAKKYTEYVCVVNNCAGTVCQETKGSCKSHACEAVPGGCVESKLTQEEIEIFATMHATNMVTKGYIDQSDFDRSKDLAKQILQNKN